MKNKRLKELLKEDKRAKEVYRFIKSDNELYFAYKIAEKAHDGQLRWNGEGNIPYIFHIIDVVRHLLDSGINDKESLITAILHDTVEDGGTTVNVINNIFGKSVAKSVHYLTYDDKNSNIPKDDYFNKLKDKDSNVINVKIADRLSKLAYLYSLTGDDKYKKHYEKIKKDTEKYFKDLINKSNKNLSDKLNQYLNNSHPEG